MSFLWDVRNRRPHYWTYVFFPLITVLLFITIYKYGERKAVEKEAHPQPEVKEVL